MHAIILCYDACAPVVNFCICVQGEGGGASKNLKKGDGDGGSSSRASAVASAIDKVLKEGNWHTEGSPYIGRKAIVDDGDGQSSENVGEIIGWIPADESKFVDDEDNPIVDDQGNPVAFYKVFTWNDGKWYWHDLEEHEVETAVKKVRMRLCCVLVLLWCTYAYVLFDQAKLIGGHRL